MSDTSPDTIFEKPVALVTGARRGIGRAICYALAAKGFDIAANDIEADADLDETLQNIDNLGAAAHPIIGDIADLNQHQNFIEQALAHFGQ